MDNSLLLSEHKLLAYVTSGFSDHPYLKKIVPDSKPIRHEEHPFHSPIQIDEMKPASNQSFSSFFTRAIREELNTPDTIAQIIYDFGMENIASIKNRHGYFVSTGYFVSNDVCVTIICHKDSKINFKVTELSEKNNEPNSVEYRLSLFVCNKCNKILVVSTKQGKIEERICYNRNLHQRTNCELF